MSSHPAVLNFVLWRYVASAWAGVILMVAGAILLNVWGSDGARVAGPSLIAAGILPFVGGGRATVGALWLAFRGSGGGWREHLLKVIVPAVALVVALLAPAVGGVILGGVLL